MGYSHFDGNEQDVMEAMLDKPYPKEEAKRDYPFQIKSLLRKKMIKPQGKNYVITERGRSAITQQMRTGEYWVGSLRPYNPNKGNSLKINLPSEYSGYLK